MIKKSENATLNPVAMRHLEGAIELARAQQAAAELLVAEMGSGKEHADYRSTLVGVMKVLAINYHSTITAFSVR